MDLPAGGPCVAPQALELLLSKASACARLRASGRDARLLARVACLGFPAMRRMVTCLAMLPMPALRHSVSAVAPLFCRRWAEDYCCMAAKMRGMTPEAYMQHARRLLESTMEACQYMDMANSNGAQVIHVGHSEPPLPVDEGLLKGRSAGKMICLQCRAAGA